MSDHDIEVFGRICELVVSATLEANGFVLWEHRDKWTQGDLVYLAPDNGLVFSDAKGKSTSTYTFTKDSEDHGIDKRQHDKYVDTAKRMQLPGTIVLFENKRETARGVFEESNKVLIFRLEDAYRTVSPRVATYGRGGMVYWRRADAKAEYEAADITIPEELSRML